MAEEQLESGTRLTAAPQPSGAGREEIAWPVAENRKQGEECKRGGQGG